MKNSRVWRVLDLDIVILSETPAEIGRLLSVTARDALKLAREFWPQAGTIKVELVK